MISKQYLIDLLERKEKSEHKIYNGYMNDNLYSNEKEWLEDLNSVKGEIKLLKQLLIKIDLK